MEHCKKAFQNHFSDFMNDSLKIDVKCDSLY